MVIMFYNYVLSSDQRFSNELFGLILFQVLLQVDVLPPIMLWPCGDSVSHKLNTINSNSSDCKVGLFATRQCKYLLHYNETFFILPLF